jgi:hypothetical protein
MAITLEKMLSDRIALYLLWEFTVRTAKSVLAFLSVIPSESRRLRTFPAPAPLLLGLAQARGSTSAPVLLTPAHPADRTVAEPRPSLLRIYQLLTPGPKQRAKIVIMTCAPQAFVLSTRKFLFSLSVFA